MAESYVLDSSRCGVKKISLSQKAARLKQGNENRAAWHRPGHFRQVSSALYASVSKFIKLNWWCLSRAFTVRIKCNSISPVLHIVGSKNWKCLLFLFLLRILALESNGPESESTFLHLLPHWKVNFTSLGFRVLNPKMESILSTMTVNLYRIAGI